MEENAPSPDRDERSLSYLIRDLRQHAQLSDGLQTFGFNLEEADYLGHLIIDKKGHEEGILADLLEADRQEKPGDPGDYPSGFFKGIHGKFKLLLQNPRNN